MGVSYRNSGEKCAIMISCKGKKSLKFFHLMPDLDIAIELFGQCLVGKFRQTAGVVV